MKRGRFIHQTVKAYCPRCVSFLVECDVDEEEYSEPCDTFIPITPGEDNENNTDEGDNQ